MRTALTPLILAIATGITAAAEDAAQQALERAVANGAPAATATPASPSWQPARAATVRLVDLSLAVVAAAGTSTATDHELEELYAGGHDPHGRGFTLQTAELALTGAVDPYFTAQAYLAASPEHGVELEEAYITTTSLPYGLEAKVGYQLIEFGRVNTTHVHAAGWIAKPVIVSRLLGGDGSRTAGARLAALLPTSWYSQVMFGAYDADDGTLVSFRGEAGHDDEHGGEEGAERSIGGRLRAEELTVGSWSDLLWLVRWENAGAIGGAEAKLGLSWLGGPNAAGENDARTTMIGADLTLGGRTDGGPVMWWKAVIEGMHRSAKLPASDELGADGAVGGGDDFTAPADTISDWGLYAQVEAGIGGGWSLGLRGEYATASGDRFETDGAIEPDGEGATDTRFRVSPLIAYRPSEFSRLRLQYDYDRAEHLEDDTAHSVWLGLDVLIGAHPAHGF
jgi:hypothetical protein